jgi:hypothetical protein
MAKAQGVWFKGVTRGREMDKVFTRLCFVFMIAMQKFF